LRKKTAQATYGRVRGEVVPPDAFDDALRLLDEYRKQKPAPAAAPAKK